VDETLLDGLLYAVRRQEVDISLVRKSPVASWTRGALMTLTGAKGSNALEHAS